MSSFPEVELTIFSDHRQDGTTIGRAQYRITNGPIFAKCIAVKSCTLYNTLPNVSENHATLSFIQYGQPNALGLLEAKIDAGSYTGTGIAAALEDAMTTAFGATAPTATVSVSYSDITRSLTFTFDNTYSYFTAPDINEYYVTIPGNFYVVNWAYFDSGGTRHQTSSQFQGGGPYRLKDWLVYCSQVFTATAQTFEAGATINISLNYYAPGVNYATFSSSIPGSAFQIPGYGAGGGDEIMRYMSMDATGFFAPGGTASYTSTEPFFFTSVQAIPNPMESILNFGIGDSVVNPQSWLSGKINLSGDLYLHFRSRILANRNHRTIENSRDTTFFSMPITSSYTQLQYYEPNQRHWITFPGGIELTDFEIELFNEFDERVSLSQNYVLELLIKQTDVF